MFWLPSAGDAVIRDGVHLSNKRELRSKATLLTAIAASILSISCASPGMKFNANPSSSGSITNIDGLKITLRPLSPQIVESYSVKKEASAAIPAELLSDKPPIYTVGPQDILLITVWDHPELSTPLGQYRTDNATGMVIDDDGTFYFPYVGRLQVRGLTIPQVREALTAQLAKILQNPQLDVKVLAFRSQKVYVGGEVKAPAVYNITDVPFTLGEAVNRAGGFISSSDDSRILLTRGGKTWTLNFQKLMASGNVNNQLFLKDGDSLHVPSALEEPVYMMGEISKPGSVPLIHGNLSLAKAISESGGILQASADARSIYVVRRADSSNDIDVFHLDARSPTSMALADRFPLRSRDIIYVDAGTLVRFSRVMNLLLPTVSAVTSTALTAAEVRNLTK